MSRPGSILCMISVMVFLLIVYLVEDIRIILSLKDHKLLDSSITNMSFTFERSSLIGIKKNGCDADK